MDVLNFLTSNILRNPPVLLGIIAGLGLIVQKKKFSDVIKGVLLAAFGMVIIDAGVTLLVGTIAPINVAFQSISGAVASEGLNDVTFTAVHGGEVGLAMLFAIILHLIIARFTKFKVIFLTGHMLWWFPFCLVAAGVEGGLTGIGLIGFAAVMSALYFSIMPWVLRKYVFKVTNDESFTLGHPTGVLSLLSGFVASKVGDTSKSTEDIKIPASFSFFREVSITGSIVIFIMYLVVGLFIPSLTADGSNLLFLALNQGIKFGAGFVVLMQGVRMLINQIVPAFKGIAEKVVPGAIPALDCPVIFNYKPNAVLIGFVTAMIVSTALILIFNSMNLFGVMLVPLVITSFFECGAAAVIGEGQGGLRGCLIGTSCAAVLMVVLLGLSAAIYTTTIQNWILIFGGNDLSLLGWLGEMVATLLSGVL
ncbi:MAG: PTS ascorbate transporter subunit IIC [Erysipelotrichaceae bacterium]|nr:PTS ascorbate transporter subunit IIC [Erysipelotrichaceae bacterium]MDY5251299.1 PTS ascorbate transporter subunit IIC [Erysipelotrichaceae bacterium]